MPARSLLVLALSAMVLCASAFSQLVQTTEDAPVAKGWKPTIVISGLEHPWSVAFLPSGDGDLLVTERPGRLRLVRDWKLVEEPIKGVPEVFARGQGGLMEISLHPKFAENQVIYLTYSAGTQERNRTTLTRAVLKDMELTDVKVIFEVQPPKSGGQHFGSRIVWLPDGTMLLAIGDGGNPPLQVDGILAREQAQALDRHPGKVLRLDENGQAPKDNPFVGKENVLPEIYSYGHRNIQGMIYDPESKRIWATEHGPRGGDELNLIEPGKNYGWPVVSHGADYRTGVPVADKKEAPEMVSPKAVWVPSKAPSGLVLYTGEHFPEWRGSMLSGALVLKHVRRIVLDGDRVVSQERLPINGRVRDVRQGPDGHIYILTDERNGELIRIEPE